MTVDTSWMLPTPVAAQRMRDAATAFVDRLSSAQRAVACFPFAGHERLLWHYTPGPRAGLLLKDMRPEQQAAALELFDAGLSLRGARTAREIIALETILAET